MSSRSITFGCRIERLGYTLLGFCAAVGLLCILKGTPVQAQGPGINLTALYNQVQALQSTVNGQAGQITTLDSIANTVYAKTLFQSADPIAKSTTFSGCNLIVNDGGGTTSTIVTNAAGDGLGNLIIGYNALRSSFVPPRPDVLTGSHNLILGDYQAYSSYGGIVAGGTNTIAAPYASITGGQNNTATGGVSSISGGGSNVASGYLSSVSGGVVNSANGYGSSISGGASNIAMGDMSAVSGGYFNTASGTWSSISGGYSNTASNQKASVSGGYQNTASGDTSAISGGFSNNVSQLWGSISGGIHITQNDVSGWAAGSQGSTNYSGNFSSP